MNHHVSRSAAVHIRAEWYRNGLHNASHPVHRGGPTAAELRADVARFGRFLHDFLAPFENATVVHEAGCTFLPEGSWEVYSECPMAHPI